MIKDLAIINFQSHKNSYLTFTKGLNVITGSSDSGKTAVLRSLLWLINNRPSGDAIRNWDCSEKDVIGTVLTLHDDTTITKNRINGKSSYIMEDKKFDAIKTDVPEEVIDILNLSELNIQPQHQSYFLLNDSAGEVSKKLNIITGLDIIDHLFSRINSEIHVINTEIKINEKEVASLDEKIKELSYLDDAFVKYERLEEEAEEYKEMVEDKNILENRIQAYRKIDLEKKSTEKTLKLEQTVKELASMVEEYTSLEKNKAKLESLWTKYNNNTWCIDKLDKEIKSFQKKYNETIRNNPICPLLNIECKELKNYDK